jgi:hypothetical protein
MSPGILETLDKSVDLNDGEIQQSAIDLTSLVRAYMRAHQ